MQQHLQAHKSQDGNQAVFKVTELLEHIGQKKYMERRPSIAKMLELNTRKGSEVMANIAGTLSTANNTSMTSMTTSATNKGVA
jgi:hypothetical protein